MLDAVLLDWENVLVDTADARREALRHALSAEGVVHAAGNGATPFEWRGVAAEAAAALASAGVVDDTLTDLVVARATSAFAERLGKGFVLRAGARELVEHLQGATRLGIVTTATRSETEFVLRLANLEAAASTVVSADDGLDAPPAPASCRRAVEQLSRRRPVQVDRVVAIVATLPSLRAARGGGVRTVSLGMPAHMAVESDGGLETLSGVTSADLARVALIAPAERPS